MSLKKLPELTQVLTTYFADADAEHDADHMASAAAALAGERRTKVTAQLDDLLSWGSLPLEELGMEANRWFASGEEAHEWLSRLAAALGAHAGGDTSDAIVVKDSNGAVLAEGDSVTTIKDLKVKGGSSDLKRGTLIKGIHLVDDAEVIECRVDGSTLVLKTCFLKKA